MIPAIERGIIKDCIAENCIVATSLGKFKPSQFNSLIIARELSALLIKLGVTMVTEKPHGVLPIGVREPSEHIRLAMDDQVVRHWHRDGLRDYRKYLDHDTRIPELHWLVMWSNGTPTAIKDEDGTTLKFEPFDIMLVNNRRVYHRAPPSESNRWFARMSVPAINATAVR